MNDTMYEAAAFAMRYWFIIAMAVILIAVIYVSVKEYSQRKYVMEEIGQYLGYIIIINAGENLLGKKYGLRQENSVGRSHRCDICVDDASLSKTHALIYKKEDNLYIDPIGRGKTLINGKKASKSILLKTGDVITLGSVEARVFLKRARVGNDY